MTTDSTHTTFIDVLRLRDAVESAPTDAECDRLSDAKWDAIDALSTMAVRSSAYASWR